MVFIVYRLTSSWKKNKCNVPKFSAIPEHFVNIQKNTAIIREMVSIQQGDIRLES